MSSLAAASPPGSRRHGRSAAEVNESTDISIESSAPSDGSDALELGSSLPSTRTDPSIPYRRDFDRDYNVKSDRSLKISESNPSETPLRRRSNRWISVVIGVTIMIAAGLGIYFYMHSNNISLSKRNESAIETANSPKVSLEELNAHSDTTSDCWVAMHDIVFDVTAYSLKHPGGPELILDYCGRNATRAFAAQHPMSYLNKLSRDTVVGVLEQATTGGAKKSNDSSTAQTTDEGSKPTSKPVEEEEKESDGEDDSATGSSTAGPTVSGTATATPTATVTAAPTATASCISLTEVAMHATRDDCWYILYDQVYDFTNFIDIHPGGARYVFQECGTDATSVYITEKKHDQNLLLQVDAPNLYLLAPMC